MWTILGICLGLGAGVLIGGIFLYLIILASEFNH